MTVPKHPDNDVTLNPTGNATIFDVLDAGEPSRRKFLRGSAGAASMAVITGVGLDALTNEAQAYTSASPSVSIGFTSVPAVNAALTTVPIPPGTTYDAVLVPPGYKAEVLIAWGDGFVGATAPNMDPTQPQTEANQLRQFGNHVDGSHFFPFPATGTTGESSDRGLFVVNHEYTDEGLHRNTLTVSATPSLAEVRASQAAHGVSIVEVRKTGNKWGIVKSSPFNRRISTLTPMRISGPAAGSPLMRTAADPTGTQVIGTANNCAAGYTPWGTYLTCEENFNGYFGRKTAGTNTPLQNRYGLSSAGFGYGWHVQDPRFDLNDTPNEANRFGWVVEIDPFNPRSVPVKRTALGRFKHESVYTVIGDDDSVACYSGDDERNDYIYKFVSSKKFIKGNTAHNRTLLDEGTLYVAKFNADGSGTWLPLVFGQGGLTTANGWVDQADVLVRTRQAADREGATMMDRPEWIAVHPTTREVYVTLTNNNRRGSNPQSSINPNGTSTAAAARPPVDAANPRIDNIYGHIIRWTETGNDPKATTFTWENFILAGDPGKAARPATAPTGLWPAGVPASAYAGNINGDIFGAPDGLWFDSNGRLWVQTDQQGDALGDWERIGVNTMSCVDPVTKQVKRFLTSPPNCEVTGVTQTPDGKTFFVGIQHPGEDWGGGTTPSFTRNSSWPDNGRNGPTTLSANAPVKPRSAILAITREDGGVIGA